MSEYASVKIRKDILSEIDPVIYKATGLRVKLQDFVGQAVEEKLEQYRRRMSKAAGPKSREKASTKAQI